MRPTVSISYCREDVRSDDHRLALFTQALEEAGQDRFEILVDDRHPDARVGSDLIRFMERVASANAVVVLLTPSYCRRVRERATTGVAYEFARIFDRLQDAQNRGTYGRSYLVLPIKFSGGYTESCPEELRRYVAEDLSWLYAIPNKRTATARPGQASRLKRVAEELAQRVAALSASTDKKFLENQEALYRRFLFQDTKSAWADPQNHPYLATAFVKTRAFLSAQRGDATFLIGRKGAGKSTITDVLPLLTEPRPGMVLRLDFELLPFDTCYHVLRKSPPSRSDIRTFSSVQLYSLVWDAFFHLAFAWHARRALSPSSQLNAFLRKRVERHLAKAAPAPERDAMATRTLFVYCFEQLVAFVDRLAGDTSPGATISDAVARLSPSRFRQEVLGATGLAEIQQAFSAKVGDARHLLLTCDGFDRLRGHAIQSTDDQRSALTFERELLLALCHVVFSKGPLRVTPASPFYARSRFCIALPHDRFLDVRQSDRERYQYRHKYSRLAWTGLELSALVRKRLALYRETTDPKGRSLEERLAAIMRRGYRELPDEITFQFGAAPYSMPLFLYVLRHTLWRPRDVLWYYSFLLTAADEARRKRQKLSVAFVRQLIANVTIPLVEDELLEEFAATFGNLRAVLMAFKGGAQCLTFEEVARCVSTVDFEILSGGDVKDVDSKIEALYDIGVLGVAMGKRLATQMSSYRHAFAFTQHGLLTSKLGRDKYPTVGYILHPVLCEFLHLDTSGNAELALPLTWGDLREHETLVGMAPG